MREAKRDRATKSKSFKCCRAKLVAHSMREHMWNAEKSMDRQRHSCHLARAHSRVCVCGAVCTRQTPIWLNKYANNNIYSTNRRTRRAHRPNATRIHSFQVRYSTHTLARNKWSGALVWSRRTLDACRCSTNEPNGDSGVFFTGRVRIIKLLTCKITV